MKTPTFLFDDEQTVGARLIAHCSRVTAGGERTHRRTNHPSGG
jgi:hypothetical protein